MNLSLLKTYLIEHYPTEVAEGNDFAIFNSMSEIAPETITGSLSASAFATWAAEGPRTAIKIHANNLNSPLNPSALSLEDFLTGSMPAFELGGSLKLQQMVGAWLAAGAITQQQYDSLFSLAQKEQTIAERDGFTDLRLEHIAEALRGGNI